MADDAPRSMAELKADIDAELADHDERGTTPAFIEHRNARPRERDDELLDELPDTDYHLGRFAGWQAVRKPRLIIGVSLAVALLVGAVLFISHSRRMRHERLHPLPEVEAMIAEGTPREMTVEDGHMRVALSREPPAINVLHLPDRDITLALGAEKAQFKVEVRDGETVKITVLSGRITETLTAPDAEPLVE
jgi:hypothetical protein